MQTLQALLTSLGLEAHYATFSEEELTDLETLSWMAKDSDSSFLSSMEELGLAVDDAQRLMSALIGAGLPEPSTFQDSSVLPSSTGAPPPTIPSAAAQPPAPAVEELPDEDVRGLVGRRVLIHSLKSRADLNGQCGIALAHDPTSGRYTVTTEGTPSVTVALKSTNLDGEKARGVPLPARAAPSRAAATVDVSDDVTSAGVPTGVSSAETSMETPERAAMYAHAARLKAKVVDPRSAEAFYKAKNKEKREEEERGLDAWKRANPAEAAKLEAAKQRARRTVGYSLGTAESTRTGTQGADSPTPTPGASKAEETVPTPAKKMEESTDLAAAIAALRAASSLPAGGGMSMSNGVIGVAPAGRNVSTVPTSDLLASVLGKVGVSTPLPAPPPPGRRPAAGATTASHGGGAAGPAVPPRAASDLLTSALGKAGVVPPPSKAPAANDRSNGAGALGAYHRRQTNDTTAVEGDYGTVSGALQLRIQREAAEKAEAKYRDKHAFLGEHYDDI